MNPAYIGWLAVAVIAVAFTAAFVAQRRRKAADHLKPKPPECRLPLFPMVHGTFDFTKGDLYILAKGLRRIYFEAWRKFGRIYGIDDPHPLAVSRIYVKKEAVLPDHPHVVWNAPRGSLGLRVQPDMEYWFASELHNVFRCSQAGVAHISKPKNPADAARAVKVQAWIEEEYRT